MKTRLDGALEDCLAVPATGRATAENCLVRYGDLAVDLGPLLRVNRRLQEVFGVQSSPLYARAARPRSLATRASRRRRPVTDHYPRARTRRQTRLEPRAGPGR